MLSISIRVHINRHIYLQDPASQRGLLQRALQGANSQDDLSATPRGGSMPTAREIFEGPHRVRNRRSSMGPDLLTGHTPRHRRSSLGPGRMEYSGGVSGELFSHGRRYRTLGRKFGHELALHVPHKASLLCMTRNGKTISSMTELMARCRALLCCRKNTLCSVRMHNQCGAQLLA